MQQYDIMSKCKNYLGNLQKQSVFCLMNKSKRQLFLGHVRMFLINNHVNNLLTLPAILFHRDRRLLYIYSIQVRQVKMKMARPAARQPIPLLPFLNVKSGAILSTYSEVPSINASHGQHKKSLSHIMIWISQHRLLHYLRFTLNVLQTFANYMLHTCYTAYS